MGGFEQRPTEGMDSSDFEFYETQKDKFSGSKFEDILCQVDNLALCSPYSRKIEATIEYGAGPDFPAQ